MRTVFMRRTDEARESPYLLFCSVENELMLKSGSNAAVCLSVAGVPLDDRSFRVCNGNSPTLPYVKKDVETKSVERVQDLLSKKCRCRGVEELVVG